MFGVEEIAGEKKTLTTPPPPKKKKIKGQCKQ